MANKAALLQHLMLEEVILRRECNIQLQAFMQGLGHLKLLELMQQYPELLMPSLVPEPRVNYLQKHYSA